MTVSGKAPEKNPNSDESLTHKLTSQTTILGLKLYIAIGIIFLFFVIALSLLLYCCCSNRKRKMRIKHSSGLIPFVSKEIVQSDHTQNCKIGDFGENVTDHKRVYIMDSEKKCETEIGGAHRRDESDASGGSRSSASTSTSAAVSVSVSVDNIGWGRWYSLNELEMATGGFAKDNVIGEGGYGVVYRGVLADGSVVAVKNLLNNKGQAEKEFKVEVEAIGKVRHKNLVGLIGYCADGAQRMLVYEYVDNGNLEQWLHGDVGPTSPLTWDIRMRIAIGTAKGLAYLHEGLEPKVVHRDVKSSNILLDRKWNPKVSDFGLAKLLGSEASYVTTRVMGTFGYVSPEYASTGMLNEWSDVYSFGILLMEIITGRSPVDYSKPAGEMNLVDWFKAMVASRRGEEVVDPLIEVQPSPRALKRVLLICLRCIDLDAHKRPKMGQIVHMLEADEFPFRSEHRPAQEKNPNPNPLPARPGMINKVTLLPKPVVGGDDIEISKWR